MYYNLLNYYCYYILENVGLEQTDTELRTIITAMVIIISNHRLFSVLIVTVKKIIMLQLNTINEDVTMLYMGIKDVVTWISHAL